jgi:hypothetical protein
MSPKLLLLRGRWIVVAVLLLAAWLILRYTHAGAPAPGGEPHVAQAAPSSGAQPTIASGSAMQLSREQVVALVRADLARHLAVPPEAITTGAIEERVWYDDSFGCWIRSGLPVDPPIAGYLLRLEHDAQSFSYHADQQGHFIRCPEPSGPRDRTTR